MVAKPRINLLSIQVLFWIFVAFLYVFIVWNGLHSSFFFDDHPNIVTNEAVHITSLSKSSLKESLNGPEAGPLGRPLSVVSFAVTHYFFGLDPFAFRMVNIFIHLINGLLVAWVTGLILDQSPRPLSKSINRQLAFWVAAVWLLHPINFQPVMLIVQRMTLLASMFLLLALGCYLTSRVSSERLRWGWQTFAWLVFWPLAIFSKETGLLLPLFVFAVHFWLPLSGKKNDLQDRGLWLALLFAVLIVAGIWHYLGENWLANAYRTRHFSLSERLMTEARVLWFYAGQIIIPDHKSFGFFLDDITISRTLTNPISTLFSCLAWFAIVFHIIRFRRKFPILSFSLGWFLLGHSLESTILPLDIAQEYRNYVPSVGLILGLGYLVTLSLKRIKLDHTVFTSSIIAALPIFFICLLTWMRADQLGNPLTGSQIEASNHPNSARANYTAGTTLFKAGYGDRNDAIGGYYIQTYYKKSVEVDPVFKHGYLGLIHWACGSGRPVETAWIAEFAHRLKQTPFSPHDSKLPGQILAPLLADSSCLSRQDALNLFNAGANSIYANNITRASFYEAASDYELLVSLDLKSAKFYLNKAFAIAPHKTALQKKLESYNTLTHIH